MKGHRSIHGPMMSIALGLVAATGVQAANVEGVVREDAGAHPPLENARVTLFEPSLAYFREVRTNDQGVFAFDAVPPGTYRLGACVRDFEYIEVEVVVGGGDVDVVLDLGPETEPGLWTIVGETQEFLDATDIGVLTADGKIFYCHDTTDPVLFDPVTGDKTFPSASAAPQGCMSGSLLEDGRIIMVGGQTPANPGSFRNAIRWVKSYTVGTNAWAWMPELQLGAGRWYPGMARLADGSFLVMGGGTAPDAVRTETCERFNLSTEGWSFTGSMMNPAEFPPSALLHTGEVLATWWPPQLYNVQTGQWRFTGNFNQPNRGWPGHSDHSIVVLADGRVAAIGALRGPDNNGVMGEIYDPETETWSLTSNPGLVRYQTEVIQLPDGRILAAGGETEVNPPPVADVLGIVKWSDLYDPATDTWRRVADMLQFREYHAVTLLVPDGRVLTTGGSRIKFQVGPTSDDVEAYTPPYLLRGVRPQITSITTTTPTRGSQIGLTLAPETLLTSVVLVGTGAHTHWVDGGVPRRLVLPVQQAGTSVTTVLPSDANVLPLGHYMLFAMVDDIPSVAVIIQVVPGPAVRADFDNDGDVDLDDFGIYQACATGAGLGPPAFGCGLADLDGDNDVDLSDFGIYQRCISGPGVAPAPACDD